MLKPTLKNTQHNIDELFDSLKELNVKNKTLKAEEKELKKEFFSEQIYSVLNTTYDLINHLDEKRAFNGQLLKFEHDIKSVDQVIGHYKKLAENAKESEDEDLVWRYEFSSDVYREFKKDHNKALQILRMMISSNLILEDTKYRNAYLPFIEKHDPKNFISTHRNYSNKELFLELYGQLEGYRISKEKIIKSAGLKLFNFFNAITHVQKKSLGDKIEHIFASLGEEIIIDIKRASKTRIIGLFNKIPLLDYDGNKKDSFYDFGLSELIDQQIKNLISFAKQTNNLQLIKTINQSRKRLEVIFIQQLLS